MGRVRFAAVRGNTARAPDQNPTADLNALTAVLVGGNTETKIRTTPNDRAKAAIKVV